MPVGGPARVDSARLAEEPRAGRSVRVGLALRQQTVPTEPPMPPRIAAIDYLRGAVIVLVVLHHAVLAYVSFGHFNPEHYLWSTAPVVDGTRWAGFDAVVILNDAFFMPLLFLLSGVFAWPSLRRKGAAAFLRARCLRLGLPFVVVVSTLMPLAHYPSFELTGSGIGFAAYWRMSVTEGPWPAGPLWFVWYLLALNGIAALLYRAFPSGLERLLQGAGRRLVTWSRFYAFLVCLALAAYLPLLAVFGRAHWFAWGPFAVQASRVGLYAMYFLCGALLGVLSDGSLSLASGGSLARRWWAWSAAALVLAVGLLAVEATRASGALALEPLLDTTVYAIVFILFGCTAALATLGLFLRFATRRHRAWESWSANSYGIYLLHYVFIVWLQFFLLSFAVSPILKAATVFAVAGGASWALVAWLRRSASVRAVV